MDLNIFGFFLHFPGHLEVVYNISLVQVATFCLSMPAIMGHWLTICYIISVSAEKQVSVQLIFISSITMIMIQCLHWIGLIPKYRSKQISPQCCRCSILLDLTFVEIKKSFTKMLLSFNFKNFRIFFSWKRTDKNYLPNVSMI